MAPTSSRWLSSRRQFLGRLAGLSALSLALAGGQIGCSPRRVLSSAASTPAPASTAVGTAAPSATPLATSVVRPTPTAQTARSLPPGRLRLATNHAAVELPWFRKVLDNYAKAQPQVKVELVNTTSRYLEQVSAWGADGSLPDVVFARGQHAAAWAYRKWLVPIEEQVSRDATLLDLADLYPGQAPELKYRDRWLALPYDFSAEVLYFRPEHFRDAKLEPPSPDWTWTDLLAVAKLLTRREGESVARWGLNWRPDHATMVGVWTSEGGSFFSEDGQGVKLNTPENLRITRWFADLSGAAGVAPRDAAVTLQEGLLGSGKASLSAGDSSDIGALVGSLPAKAQLDVALLPRGVTGLRASVGSGSGWAMSRDAHDRELAWDLLKHLASRDSLELLVALPLRNLPGRASAAQLWLDGLKAVGAPEHPDVFTRSARESLPLRPTPWWLDYQDAYDDLMPQVWDGKRTADAVLPELESRVNAAARRYQ